VPESTFHFDKRSRWVTLLILWRRQLSPQPTIRFADHVARTDNRFSGQFLNLSASISGYFTCVVHIPPNIFHCLMPVFMDSPFIRRPFRACG
jgi:hypothetical protein